MSDGKLPWKFFFLPTSMALAHMTLLFSPCLRISILPPVFSPLNYECLGGRCYDFHSFVVPLCVAQCLAGSR